MSSYARKYTGKRKYSGTRSTFRANSSGTALVRQPAYKASASSAMPMAELKSYDTYTNTGAQTVLLNPDNFQLSNAGVVRVLNSMAQGSDFNARIGRKVTNASITVNFHIRRNAEAVIGEDTYVRMMLIWDKQPNGAGALPTIADFINVGTTTNTNIMKGHNLDNRQRFVFLYDQTKHLATVDANQAGYNASVDVSVTKSLARAPTQYTGQAAVSIAESIGSIATGALYLFVCGSIMGGAANPGWNCIATSRLRYYDT